MAVDVELYAPWVIYANRVSKLFEDDGDVVVMYDDFERSIEILVNGNDKAEAISNLLPQRKQFGNVTIQISVIPSNEPASKADLFKRAFSGNSAFDGVVEGYGPANDVTYALFKPEAVQLSEDDISQFGGFATITYAELAKSVVQCDDVFVSSSIKM